MPSGVGPKHSIFGSSWSSEIEPSGSFRSLGPALEMNVELQLPACLFQFSFLAHKVSALGPLRIPAMICCTETDSMPWDQQIID